MMRASSASSSSKPSPKVPSVEPFQKQILMWDFFEDVYDDRTSTAEELQQFIHSPLQIKSICKSFEDEATYIHSFLPLLYIECRQSIHKAKETDMGVPLPAVKVDGWLKNDFVFLKMRILKESASSSYNIYGNGDLIILYTKYKREVDENASLGKQSELSTLQEEEKKEGSEDEKKKDFLSLFDQLKKEFAHILGIVESSAPDSITVKVIIQNSTNMDKKRYVRLCAIIEAIRPNDTLWYLNRVVSLSTMYREYQGLLSFKSFILKDEILCRDFISESTVRTEPLNPQASAVAEHLQPSRHKVQLLEIPSVLNDTLKSLYNESQFEALQDCLKVQGITLIQGPPGTGKTTTIMGILSVILNASARAPSFADLSLESKGGGASAASKETKKPIEEEKSRSNRCACVEDEKEQRKIEKRKRARRLIMLSQPWIYAENYTFSHDTSEYSIEDLNEKRQYATSSETDAMVVLTPPENAATPKRVLVCAPSNAAIDEILKRLTLPAIQGGGIFDEKGQRYTPTVVRVGPNIHPDLLEYGLEHQAVRRMKSRGSYSNNDRPGIKTSILESCKIVCATLSMCGSRDFIAFSDTFDTVVVDEASQGVEVSTLIPLRLGCRRLILVGDHRQLPATVISRVAIQQNYSQSLFQRLQVAGYKVNMLSIQYRMHPEISKFPSSIFYENQLKDADDILSMVKPPIDWYSIPIFKPMVFFAIDSAHAAEGTSLVNYEEASFAVQLVDLLGSMLLELGITNWCSKLAIISPYANQVRLLRKLLKEMFQLSDSQACPIDVNTVDGFQGREKDYVIFSAVRAKVVNEKTPGEDLSVGFLADERRMNVALTRARKNLWVIGNGRFLMGSPHWASFWRFCAASNSLFNVNFERLPRENYLRRWLSLYFERQPKARKFFEQNLPAVLKKTEILAKDRLLSRDLEQTFKETFANSRTDGLLKKLLEEASAVEPAMEYSGHDEGDYEDLLLNSRTSSLPLPGGEATDSLQMYEMEAATDFNEEESKKGSSESFATLLSSEGMTDHEASHKSA